MKSLFLAALLSLACSAQVVDAPTSDDGPVSCSIDEALSQHPEDLCPTSQFGVYVCTRPTALDPTAECNAPKDAEGHTPPTAGTVSAVWCCK